MLVGFVGIVEDISERLGSRKEMWKPTWSIHIVLSLSPAAKKLNRLLDTAIWAITQIVIVIKVQKLRSRSPTRAVGFTIDYWLSRRSLGIIPPQMSRCSWDYPGFLRVILVSYCGFNPMSKFLSLLTLLCNTCGRVVSLPSTATKIYLLRVGWNLPISQPINCVSCHMLLIRGQNRWVANTRVLMIEKARNRLRQVFLIRCVYLLYHFPKNLRQSCRMIFGRSNAAKCPPSSHSIIFSQFMKVFERRFLPL